MKHVVWMTMLALSLATGSVGCGDDDDDAGGGDEAETDNVGACEDWKEAVSCDGADLSLLEQVSCDTYAQTECDVSAYFDCLSENTTCNGSQLDITGWAGCAELATCM